MSLIIYLIEEAWADSMENEHSKAFGYKAIGFVEDEVDAKEICERGGVVGPNYCWAVMDADTPYFRYRAIPSLGGLVWRRICE